MALGAASRPKQSYEESLINSDIDAALKLGTDWQQIQKQLDGTYREDVYSPILERRIKDAGESLLPNTSDLMQIGRDLGELDENSIGLTTDQESRYKNILENQTLSEEEQEVFDEALMKGRTDATMAHLEEVFGPFKRGQVTEAMRYMMDHTQPIQPIARKVLTEIPIDYGQKDIIRDGDTVPSATVLWDEAEYETVYDPNAVEAFNQNVEKWNYNLEKAKKDTEIYNLTEKQFKQRMDDAQMYIDEQTQLINEGKQAELIEDAYWEGVKKNAELTNPLPTDAAQPFVWTDYNGRQRNIGNMHIGDLGMFQLYELTNEKEAEYAEIKKADPAYVEYMSEPLTAFGQGLDQYNGMSPQDIVDQIIGDRNIDDIDPMELTLNKGYMLAMDEIVRRNQDYDVFFESRFLAKHLLENTFKDQTPEQLEAAERHIYDRFGLKVDLTGDNYAGGVNNWFKDAALSFGGAGVMGLSKDLGGIVLSVLDGISGGRLEGVSKAWNDTFNSSIQAAKDLRSQQVMNRTMFEKFGESSYNLFNEEDLISRDLTGINAIGQLLAQGDDFSRQEQMDMLESAPGNLYNQFAAVALTGGRSLSGFKSGGAFGALRSLGIQEASAGLVGGARSYGNRYLEIVSNEDERFLYNNYTDSEGNSLNPTEAMNMLAEAQMTGEGQTFDDLGIAVDRSEFKIYGHAVGDGAAEGVPEFLANRFTAMLGKWGNGKLGKTGMHRLGQYIIGYSGSMAINVEEEGVTEWVTSLWQQYNKSLITGEPWNWNKAMEKASEDYILGQMMAPFGSTIAQGVGIVKQEKMISEGLANNPEFITIYNLQQVIRNQEKKASGDAQSLININKILMNPNLPESTRAAYMDQARILQNKLSEKDKILVNQANTLAREHKQIAHSMIATNSIMQRLEAEYAAASELEDDNQRRQEQDRLHGLIEEAVEHMEELKKDAAIALKKPVSFKARDGQGNQLEQIMVERPATPEELAELEGLTSKPDPVTASLQDESETGMTEYDDDLEAQIERENDVLIIKGALADGTVDMEGKVDDESFNAKFQDGVLDLLKNTTPFISNNAYTTAHGSRKAFEQDKDVIAYAKENGIPVSQVEALAVTQDGRITGIIVGPHTSQKAVIHELGHAGLRKAYENDNHRTALVRELYELGQRKGNEQLAGWLNATMIDYDLKSDQLNENGMPDISKLSEPQQEELLNSFLDSMATNEWAGMAGGTVNFSFSKMESLSSAFWDMVSDKSELAERMNVNDRAGLIQVISRFKASMPKQKPKDQKNVLDVGVIGEGATISATAEQQQPEEISDLLSSRETKPTSVEDAVQAIEEKLDQKKPVEAPVQEEVKKVGTQQPPEEAPAQPIGEKLPTETAEEYAARLQAEADRLLAGTEGISTPDTDVLSQDDNVDVSRLGSRRRDWLSGKKVTGTYINYLGYGKTFTMEAGDYFHFRNWYNKMTGNGTQPFDRLSYTDDKGQRKELRPPKPRTRKDGTPYKMTPLVDRRTIGEAFSAAKRELMTGKKLGMQEQLNRYERLRETLLKNNMKFEDIGLGQFRGSNTYAELEAGEVRLMAMLSNEPGAIYDIGIISPVREEGKTPQINPSTMDRYNRGREKGFAYRDRERQIKDGNTIIAGQSRLLDFKSAIDQGIIEVSSDLLELLNGMPEGTPVFAAVEKYAPIEPAQVRFRVGGKLSKPFNVTGGAFQSAVDAQKAVNENGSFNPGDIAATANTLQSQQTRVWNATIQRGQDLGAESALVLIKHLEQENPLGDKTVSDGIFSLFEMFSGQGEQQAEIALNSINKVLSMKMPKSTRTFGNYVVEKMLGPTSSKAKFSVNKNGDLQLTDKGQISLFRNLFINFKHKDYLGNRVGREPSFDWRKNMMDRLLNKKTFNSKEAVSLGFPKRSNILETVGVQESQLRSSDVNDIFYAVEIDLNAAQKDLEAIDTPAAERRQYPYQVTGFKKLHVFGKAGKNGEWIPTPISESSVRNQMKAVDPDAMRGASQAMASGFTGRLAYRNRAGRITHHGKHTWEKSEMNKYGAALSSIALKFQDKYFEVNMLQQDIQDFKGQMVSEDQDFIMGVDLMYGRAASRLSNLEEAQQQLQDLMKEYNISSDDLSTYLYAKHVPERNLHISKLNPSMLAGSGKDNMWAQETVKRLETGEMRRLANIVYSIIQNTRKTMVEYGLEEQERIDAWNDMYDFYVPLAGLATDELNENNLRYPTGGAGMAMYGSLVKKAKGRKSEVTVNVVAQAIMQNAMTIQAAEKNKAMNRLYELVKNNPNEKVWAIANSEVPLTSIGNDGLARQMTVAEMKLDPHTVPVRVNGKQEFIYFKDKNYANTMNGATVERAGFIVASLNNVTGWLRNVFTIYDPNFFLSNFARDIQSAIPNAIAEIERQDGYITGLNNPIEFTAQVMNETQKSLRSLLRNAAFGRDMDPVVEDYRKEWEEAGGKTGWGYTKDISKLIEELEKASNERSAWDQIFSTPKKFAGYVEGINDAFEQAIRLGAYTTARKNGIGVEKAAQLSKNITVNFNRGGEWQFMNAVYLFFNAAMQGNARIFRSMFYMNDVRKANGELESWHKRVSTPQKIAFAMTTFTGLMTMINLAMSGTDDEGDGKLWYDKISDYEKERNLIFMHRDGKNYTKIALPYGYNIFANMGVATAETFSGHREPWSALMFLLNSGMSAFSPISFGQSKDLLTYGTKAAAPTIAKPIVEVVANETYFGSQVYKDRLPFDTTPYSELAYKSPEFMQEFFAWVNETTGGSKYRSGDFDVNPDKIWYLFEYFLGGSGRFVTNTGSLVANGARMAENSFQIAARDGLSFEDFENLTAGFQGENRIMLEPSDIPIARKVYGTPSKYFDSNLFRENQLAVRQLHEEMMKAPKAEQGRYSGIIPLYNILLATNKSLKTLRDTRSLIRDDRTMDHIKKANRLTEIEESERQLMARYNKLYEQFQNQN